jgi:hypothetical protein
MNIALLAFRLYVRDLQRTTGEHWSEDVSALIDEGDPVGRYLHLAADLVQEDPIIGEAEANA